MSFVNSVVERSEQGGVFTDTIALRPVAFLNSGSWQRILSSFADGDINFPQVVLNAPFFSYIDAQGNWRVHPTRDPNVWFSIGAPFINPATPTRVALNPFSRVGNVLTSVNANFDARIIHAGHYMKLEAQLKGGFVPPQSKLAFPIVAQGVTRVGTQLQVNGVTVMNLTAPAVYDAANRDDVRPITVAFTSVSGQAYIIYTLPSLTGMTAPVIDPTLTLQPDATAGKDTYIYSFSATTNFGTQTTIPVGNMSGSVTRVRSLLAFDVSSVPAGATLTAATLSLFEQSVGTEIGANVFTARIKRLLRNWVEAEATWNIYSIGNNWSVAGGSSGSDYSATDSATWTYKSPALNAFRDFATAQILTDVSNFVSGAVSNFGWLLIGDQPPEQQGQRDTDDLSSSDHATAGQRPKLAVVYSFVAQSFAGTVIPTGALTKTIKKIYSGVSTPVGALTKQDNKSVVGTVTPVGAFAKQASKSVNGSLAPSGALAKFLTKPFAGALSSVGALSKQANKSVAGTIVSSGVLTRLAQTAFAGVIAGSGALVQSTRKAFEGVLSPAGELVHTVLIALNGTLSISGALQKTVLKGFSGFLTLAGNVTRLVQTQFAGVIGLVGELNKNVQKAFAGQIGSAGALAVTRLAFLTLAGVISSSGTLRKSVVKALGGLLGWVGTLTNKLVPPVRGSVELSDSLQFSVILQTSAVFTVELEDSL